MLCFSVFEIFSGWVLLSSETIHLHNSHRLFLMSPYYCGPKGTRHIHLNGSKFEERNNSQGYHHRNFIGKTKNTS